MPIYKNGKKIKHLFIGSREISRLYHGSTLVHQAVSFPVDETVPTGANEVLVAQANGNTSVVYEVPESGFYKVSISASAGTGAYKNGTVTYAGGCTKTVYLFKGSKCLLWGASGTNTGYPGEKNTYVLGATGIGNTGGESGGGGGGPTCNAAPRGDDGGYGGAGAGFLAGLPVAVAGPKTHNESAWRKSVSTDESWTAGSYSVRSLYCRILCGGSGGNCSDNGSWRSGGSGGGAWGDSGTNTFINSANEGPGGTWGKGGNSARYSAGGWGAWCIMDFSRNQWEWGQGGGVGSGGAGYCRLYALKI